MNLTPKYNKNKKIDKCSNLVNKYYIVEVNVLCKNYIKIQKNYNIDENKAFLCYLVS